MFINKKYYAAILGLMLNSTIFCMEKDSTKKPTPEATYKAALAQFQTLNAQRQAEVDKRSRYIIPCCASNRLRIKTLFTLSTAAQQEALSAHAAWTQIDSHAPTIDESLLRTTSSKRNSDTE